MNSLHAAVLWVQHRNSTSPVSLQFFRNVCSIHSIRTPCLGVANTALFQQVRAIRWRPFKVRIDESFEHCQMTRLTLTFLFMPQEVQPFGISHPNLLAPGNHCFKFFIQLPSGALLSCIFGRIARPIQWGAKPGWKLAEVSD